MLPSQAKCLLTFISAIFFLNLVTFGAPEKKKETNKDAINDTIKSSELSGLKLRSIGPAFTSGRIADFAVNGSEKSPCRVAGHR